MSAQGQDIAVQNFEKHLMADSQFRRQIAHLTLKSLLCHCVDRQRCHGDVLIAEFLRQFPQAYDRQAPTQQVAPR